MRLLHTSDWHVGRTFHGHDTLPSLQAVVAGMVEVVRSQEVDVVLVSGDVFDRSAPSAAAFAFLDQALVDLRDAGARIVLISGNHDGAERLAFMSGAAAQAGIHVRTRVGSIADPVVILDADGPVLFYAIPYLEPVLARHALGDDTLRTHEGVLGAAMDRVRADLAGREAVRSVVLAHCFAAGGSRSDTERDIAVGGVEQVPTAVFDGPTYVALGHLHSRQTLSERIRYCGAPLAYSFGEGDRPRGGWLVDLTADGLDKVCWAPFPVPRRLRQLTGTIDALLSDPAYDDAVGDWVEAHLTDPAHPLDAMSRLQSRFPHCAHLEWHPPNDATDDARSYRHRLRGRTDTEIAVDFLGHVRHGVSVSATERQLVDAAFEAVRVDGDR